MEETKKIDPKEIKEKEHDNDWKSPEELISEGAVDTEETNNQKPEKNLGDFAKDSRNKHDSLKEINSPDQKSFDENHEKNTNDNLADQVQKLFDEKNTTIEKLAKEVNELTNRNNELETENDELKKQLEEFEKLNIELEKKLNNQGKYISEEEQLLRKIVEREKNN